MFTNSMEGYTSNALIYPDGEVLHVPDTHFEALCNDEEPGDIWDEKNCTLKYGSWTYDGLKMNLTFYEDKRLADFDEFLPNISPVKVKFY
jgi:hypothetical protein